jgi:transcriptional regulator with PAS, ATPase and Fis domain
MELYLPPLRERGDDILELAHFVLDKTCRQLNRAHMELSRECLDVIVDYRWPGNVRELENAMERAVILAENNDLITPDLLAIDSTLETAAAEQSGEAEDLSLEAYFRRFLLEHQDDVTETELARRLGISRKTLWERRQRFGIPRAKKTD